jgi:hypothetical protein
MTRIRLRIGRLDLPGADRAAAMAYARALAQGLAAAPAPAAPLRRRSIEAPAAPGTPAAGGTALALALTGKGTK